MSSQSSLCPPTKLVWKGPGYVATYVGAVVGGIPHGTGGVWWHCSPDLNECKECVCCYSGEFMNGSRHGRGELHYSDGSVYEGEWLDNQKVGAGVFIFPSGFSVSVPNIQVVSNRLQLDENMNLVNAFENLSFDVSDLYLSAADQATLSAFVETNRAKFRLLFLKVREFNRKHSTAGIDEICMHLEQFWTVCDWLGLFSPTYTMAMLNRVICRSSTVISEMSNAINKGLKDIHSGERRMMFRHFVEAVLRVCIDTTDNSADTLKLANRFLDLAGEEERRLRGSQLILSGVQRITWDLVSTSNSSDNRITDRTARICDLSKILAYNRLSEDILVSIQALIHPSYPCSLDEELIFAQFTMLT